MAGLSVPVHVAPWSFLMAVAGAVIFENVRPSLPREVTSTWTFASLGEKLATVEVQWLTPVCFGMVVGAQVLVRVTAPCFLKKATGMTTALPLGGVSVILPKC